MRSVIQGPLLWPDGQIRPGHLTVEGRQIHSMDEAAAATPDSADTVLAIPPGGVAAPGFIDLQIHGAFGHDFTTYPALVMAAARYLPRFGVTAFLPTLISTPLERYLGAAAAIKNLSVEPETARVLGLHLEGPYLNPTKAGAHTVQYLRRPNVTELYYIDPAVVRLVTLAPELPGALPLIRALLEIGVQVGLGHSAASYEQTIAAVDEGARWATHLFNAMAPLHHRHPGIVGALLSDPRLRLALIADGVHLHPAILRLAAAAKGAANITLVSDAVAAAGMSRGEYLLGVQKITVDNNAVRLDDGTLAGSLIMLDQAVRNMVNLAGWPLNEALIMASMTPADVLGLTHKGRLAPGYDADVVILNNRLQVVTALIEGRVAYQA